MAHAPELLALMARPCINHAWEAGRFIDQNSKPICLACAKNL